MADAKWCSYCCWKVQVIIEFDARYTNAFALSLAWCLWQQSTFNAQFFMVEARLLPFYILCIEIGIRPQH